MSDPTDATPDGLEPPAGPPPTVPEPPSTDETVDIGPIGDETARIPVEPEVGWAAPSPPEPSRALPWEAPPGAVPPVAPAAAPVAPAALTTAEGTSDAGDPSAAAGGVLSAATVGWIAPPPEPVATGRSGWIIAGVGTRVAAWLLDGFIGFVLFFIVAIVFGIIAATAGMDVKNVPSWTYLIAVLGFYFVYFVGFWTSQGKATPGMRVFKLQVANAADGKRLEIGPAVTRWLALGYAISLVGVIPVLASFTGIATFIWSIVLLITASQDTMHQGLHDRWAKTVVVRPESAGSGGGALAACLIVALIVVAIMMFTFVALIFLGSQISGVLSEVGQSV
jgi:uncharacterized RDD family membrane protein YckC